MPFVNVTLFEKGFSNRSLHLLFYSMNRSTVCGSHKRMCKALRTKNKQKIAVNWVLFEFTWNNVPIEVLQLNGKYFLNTPCHIGYLSIACRQTQYRFYLQKNKQTNIFNNKKRRNVWFFFNQNTTISKLNIVEMVSVNKAQREIFEWKWVSQST